MDALDRTVPEAYTKRSRGVTEKRAELLSEGLFNTLLLSIWGDISGAFDCKKKKKKTAKER